jgi:hypothetical protein
MSTHTTASNPQDEQNVCCYCAVFRGKVRVYLLNLKRQLLVVPVPCLLLWPRPLVAGIVQAMVTGGWGWGVGCLTLPPSANLCFMSSCQVPNVLQPDSRHAGQQSTFSAPSVQPVNYLSTADKGPQVQRPDFQATQNPVGVLSLTKPQRILVKVTNPDALCSWRQATTQPADHHLPPSSTAVMMPRNTHSRSLLFGPCSPVPALPSPAHTTTLSSLAQPPKHA